MKRTFIAIATVAFTVLISPLGTAASAQAKFESTARFNAWNQKSKK